MTSRTLTIALAALTAALPGAVMAGSSDTAAAVNACLAGYPDSKSIAAHLTAAGLTDLGEVGDGNQGLHMFRSADGATIAGTQGKSETNIRCLVLEDGLSPRKAGALADAMLKQMPGSSEVPVKTQGALAVSSYHTGMLQNRMTGVMVVKSYPFGKVKGAALLVITQ